VLAIGLSACTPAASGTKAPTASASSVAAASATPTPITPPTDLVKPGQLTFLSDTTYPPQESIDPSTQQAIGFDIDIAQAIAAKLGLTAFIQRTDSSALVQALLAKRGDAVISALQITPDLEKEVALVGYFQAGQSILVRKGNPLNITSLGDLCGKKVAVQVQSPEEASIDDANAGICQSSKINKQIYPVDLEAIAILKQNGVAAALDDSPVADYFVKQDPSELDLGGPPFKLVPEGIAVNPQNSDLLNAVQQAMLAIDRDGTYRQILIKWNLLDGEIPSSEMVVNPSPSSS
jgi:polar amino acid transport system substrate-binding protein